MQRHVLRLPALCAILSVTLLIGNGCSLMGMVTTGTVPPPKAGTNLLAGTEWEYSADRGQSWTKRPRIVRGGKKAVIYARTSFQVDDPSGYVCLELSHGLPGRTRMFFRLNDEPVSPPEAGMYYQTIPAIPASLLKPGRNVLEAKFGYDNRPPANRPGMWMPNVRIVLARCLVGLRPTHIRITSGPILGAIERDYFTVTCRTNMPARVAGFSYAQSGKPMGFVGESESGLVHRLRLARAAGDGPGLYVLFADNGRHAAAEVVRAPAYPKPGESFRFLAMGDSRTYPDKWAAVAAAALNARPQLVVFSGDMVARGRNDWEWDEQFFGPGKEFFAGVPFYAVIGNHEENAPIYPKLFYTPGEDGLATNWIQEINGVLLIGIDGREDWSADGENAQWLEGILHQSQARFTFLFSHYPAWSSSSHGRLRPETGLPREGTVRQARETIVPLLVKYKATAFITGHDHTYERSELPGGLTHIISGGAGAPLRVKTPEAARQNPYSVVFASVLHYCLFEIDGDICTMKAITPEGAVIDSRSWKARDLKLTDPPPDAPSETFSGPAASEQGIESQLTWLGVVLRGRSGRPRRCSPAAARWEGTAGGWKRARP